MSMFKRMLLILTMLIIYQKTAYTWKPDTDYCTVDCEKGKKHTVCKRKNECGPVKNCIMIPSTPAFREEMVKLHNEFREKLASGNDSGMVNETKTHYFNRGAKNMKAVSYDMEMEYIATCWTNMCEGLTHDKCRNSKRFHVGQNVYYGDASFNEVNHSVSMWYNEIQYMTDESWIDRMPTDSEYPDKEQRGHFTQVVWAKTKYIGCARSKDKKNKILLICNYGPRGNMMHESVYKHVADASEIASDCGAESRNLDYPSLCGKVDPIPTDEQYSAGYAWKISNRTYFVLLFAFAFIFTNN